MVDVNNRTRYEGTKCVDNVIKRKTMWNMSNRKGSNGKKAKTTVLIDSCGGDNSILVQ